MPTNMMSFLELVTDCVACIRLVRHFLVLHNRLVLNRKANYFSERNLCQEYKESQG